MPKPSITRRSLLPVLVAVVSGSLAAQIQVNVAPATPYSVDTTVAGVTNSVTQAAGPAPTFVSRSLGVQTVAAAGFGWVVSESPWLPSLGTTITNAVNLTVQAPNASANKPVSDLVIELGAAVPTPLRITPYVITNLVGAGQLPQWDVDFGDDGSFEYAATMPVLPVVTRVVGPQPLRIRMRVGASLPAIGVMQYQMLLDVRPDNGVSVVLAGPGTACSSSEILVAPIFASGGGDVAWRGLYTSVWPQLAVVGFTPLPVPVALPPALAIGPNCLLATSPDVLLWLDGATPVALPIPAALRPLSLWTQGLSLEPNGLSVATPLRIDAN